MTYNLGIDIGIASVGFAGVNLTDKKIICCGVHIFEAAENPKDGASLATPRREKRGLRRVIRRRSVRKNAIRQLLDAHGLDTSTIDMPENVPEGQSVWDLRKEGIERLLTDSELARVLFHIAKRRGADYSYNSRKENSNDKETQITRKAATELEERMVRAGVPTIGVLLAGQPKKRNGNGTYENFVTRDLLRSEIRQIFEAQRRLGNQKASQKLYEAYAGSGKNEEARTIRGEGIAFFQNPLQSSEKMIGDCTFERGEKRAPKFSYTAELFILWSKINNTKIINRANSSEDFLTQDQKSKLANLAHKNVSGVSYKQARKELDLSDDERFNISYRKIKDDENSWEKIREATESKAASFLKLPGYHALKNALATGSDTDWQTWVSRDREKLDQIAYILSFFEDPQEISKKLAALGLDREHSERLSAISNFSKTVDLSLKAIRTILPHLQNGMTYDKACKEAGYDHSRKENKGLGKVPAFDDVRNPVVNRALGQTRKVINAVIREHGMPETIIVELARDVGKPFGERSPKAIEKLQKQNEAYRKEARDHVAEILRIIPDNVSGEDILKYRLWYREQGKFCFYCGSQITTEEFIDDTATQIDHIIPRSRSWNDSYMNKTLCHTRCNQEKGNRTPYEWFGDTQRWAGLLSEVRKLPPKKAENFLIENFDDEKAKEWKSRALNDTRYMARLLKNHLEQSLALGTGSRVQTRNGSLTANLRGAWGFGEKDRGNDRHHAIDAVVIACSTQGQVKQFADWNKYEARKKNPAERPRPPAPWENFRNDVMDIVRGPKDKDGKRTGGIFVSRMPVRKITGAAHQETIRSIRKSDGKVIQRVKLAGLSSTMLENIVDKERNIKLYTLLKERLDAHSGKADKAFAEPVYMPVNDASKVAPRVNSIRIQTSEKSGIEINEGLASNGDQIRIDVFLREGKYFAVPVYAHHFAQDNLPNRAIIANTPEDAWEIMNNDEFLFSLYKNDLVRVQSKTENYYAYYMGTIDRATGAISIRAHDNDPSFGKDGSTRTGIKTLLAFEKYSVDYFGNKHRILKEQRLGVAHGDDSESSETQPLERAVAAGE